MKTLVDQHNFSVLFGDPWSCWFILQLVFMIACPVLWNYLSLLSAKENRKHPHFSTYCICTYICISNLKLSKDHHITHIILIIQNDIDAGVSFSHIQLVFVSLNPDCFLAAGSLSLTLFKILCTNITIMSQIEAYVHVLLDGCSATEFIRFVHCWALKVV